MGLEINLVFHRKSVWLYGLTNALSNPTLSLSSVGTQKKVFYFKALVGVLESDGWRSTWLCFSLQQEK